MNPPLHPEHDDLEWQLQAQLERYAPEAPERLWAGIETQIRKRRHRPVLWLWLWLSGTAAALILVSFAYRFIRENRVSTPILHCVELKPVERQNRTIRNEVKHTKKVGSTPAASLPFTETGNQKIPYESVRKRAAFAQSTEQYKDVIKDNNLEPGFLSLKSTSVNTNIGQEPSVAVFNGSFTPAGLLPSRALQVLKNGPPVSVQALYLPTRRVGKKHWQVGMVAAPVWLWQPAALPNSPSGGHIVFAERQEGPATGWQEGLNVGYAISPRWQVTAGLFRRNIIQNSSHTATLRLVDGICLNPNDYGPKEYEFQYGLYSRTGESNLTVHIAQVDTANTMADDEPFILDMRTTRRSSDWLFPLMVQRYFGSGRWQGFVQAGGQLSLPGRSSARVDHFTEACVDLCFASGRMPALAIMERRPVSLSWLIGAGVEYRFAPCWGLTVTPTFFRQTGQAGLSLNVGLHLKL